MVTEGDTSVVDFALDPAPIPAGTGTIKGAVTDAVSGAKLRGVLVEAGGQSATTNRGGRYTINDVPEGSHTVTAEKSGYVTGSQPVDVVADQTTSANFALQPN